MNPFKLAWWAVVDALSFPPRELYIDPKRINQEVSVERRKSLDDDAGYRKRVKTRMTEGTKCQYPPLFNRKRLLSRRRNVVGFRAKEAGGGKANQTKP